MKYLLAILAATALTSCGDKAAQEQAYIKGYNAALAYAEEIAVNRKCGAVEIYYSGKGPIFNVKKGEVLEINGTVKFVDKPFWPPTDYEKCQFPVYVHGQKLSATGLYWNGGSVEPCAQ